jgi:hypothetical protein
MTNQRIKELIGNDKSKEAINALTKLTQTHGLVSEENQLFILSGQLTKLHNSSIIGIDPSVYKVQKAQIDSAILILSDSVFEKIKQQAIAEQPVRTPPPIQSVSDNDSGSRIGFLFIVGLCAFLYWKGCFSGCFTKREPNPIAIQMAERMEGEKLITADYCNGVDSDSCAVFDYWVVNFYYRIENETEVVIEGKGVYSLEKDEFTNSVSDTTTGSYIFRSTKIDFEKGEVHIVAESETKTIRGMVFNNWSDEKFVRGVFSAEGYADGYIEPKLELQSRIKKLLSPKTMYAQPNMNADVIGELSKGEMYELYGFGKKEQIGQKSEYWRYICIKKTVPEFVWIWGY